MFKTADLTGQANIHIKKYKPAVDIFRLIFTCNGKEVTSVVHCEMVSVLFSSTIYAIMIALYALDEIYLVSIILLLKYA